MLIQNIQVYNKETEDYEFYTDGSLSNRGTRNIRMRAAWKQIQGPRPGSSFKTSIEDWPSVCRAEVIAIATALLTVPQDQKSKYI